MSLTCINEKGELAIDGTFAVPYKLEKGETCDTFSSKILHTEYQFSLDLTPHGDVAILHTSHGGDFKVRILPVQGDFLVKPVNLRQGLFGYKGGKADLEADLAKFERGKCVDSIDGMELATLNRGLRMYAIRHGAYMDNSGRSIDEEYAILKASPDFAYGKDCTKVWEEYFKTNYQVIGERNNFHAPLRLAQAEAYLPVQNTDGTLTPVNGGSRVCLYELVKDKTYVITNEIPSGKGATFTLPATRAEAEKQFRFHTKDMTLLREEDRERMLPDCRRNAKLRQQDIDRALEIPTEKRTGKEQFMALLGEAMKKDPRTYGEFAVKQSRKLGWTEEQCKTALNRFAPDAALDPVSRTFPYADAVIHKLAFDRAKRAGKER